MVPVYVPMDTMARLVQRVIYEIFSSLIGENSIHFFSDAGQELKCLNGGMCLRNGACECKSGFRGIKCI
jgi:hypothetical protein